MLLALTNMINSTSSSSSHLSVKKLLEYSKVASGEELDAIGTYVDFTRHPNESDHTYRGRLRKELSRRK